jgi:hypothetical protein
MEKIEFKEEDVGKIFDIVSGNDIDEKIFYNHPGKVPVVSGQTSNNGIRGLVNSEVLSKISNLVEKESITITKDGVYSGKMFYRDSPFFLGGHCHAITLKEEWKDKIDLKWFCYTQQENIFRYVSSKAGNGTIPKEILSRIKVRFPTNISFQKKLVNKYFNLQKLKNKMEIVNKKINDIFNKNLIFENKDEAFIKLNLIFRHVSRNDSLSEEGIYKKSSLLKKSKRIITVLSGSTDGIYGYYPFEDDIHIVNNKPCIQVVTRGDAGKLRFLKKGTYATNTNSMLMVMKEDIKDSLNIHSEKDEEIYLNFLDSFLQPYFKEYCSHSDLAVFPLTQAIQDISIPLIKIDKVLLKIVKKYTLLKKQKVKIRLLIKKIDELFSKEII